MLLKTNFNREITKGSIEDLISKIQEGKKIRIGWELSFNNDGVVNVEHWVDAEFISILNGHVFNQIQPIYQQVPKAVIPQIQIVQSPMQWTAIIGTNGKLFSRFIYPNLGEVTEPKLKEQLEKVTQIKEHTVSTSWAIG